MVTTAYSCMQPEVCDNYLHLKRKLRRLQPKNYIRDLARPKRIHTFKSFKRKCKGFYIDIERFYPDRFCGTRTEQLAYVSTRKLKEFKKNWNHMFSWRRIASINRHIRRSLLSMYSRMHNVQAPKPPKPKKKWEKEDWEAHAGSIKKLATPKKEIKVEPPFRKKKPISAFRRTERLATPRKYKLDDQEIWKFTYAMKNYKPSTRLKFIAEPKPPREDVHNHPKLPVPIGKRTLKYKPSERILELSKFRVRGKSEKTETDDNPFKVSEKALKYKATPRIKEMAEPKDRAEPKVNDPNVSPAALKAKAKPRIIELAEPKPPITPKHPMFSAK